MRRERALYSATFGSMTAAAVVVIALIILSGGGGDDGRKDPTVRAVVADQNIAAGTEITEDMIKVVDVPEELLVTGAYGEVLNVVGQVTMAPIAEGEQVTASKIGSNTADSGAQSYMVPPGQRTGSVEVPSPSPSFR
jgi:Flp pilus assembly protein CpaB